MYSYTRMALLNPVSILNMKMNAFSIYSFLGLSLLMNDLNHFALLWENIIEKFQE